MKPAKKKAAAPVKAKKPRARPHSYTAEIHHEIVRRLATGEPLTIICGDEHMPDDDTVRRWGKDRPALESDIARARLRGFDAIAAEALAIANTPCEGVETVTKADGGIEERRGDMLGHRKLQVETRLKLLAKWDPKRYGEKQQVEHSGGLTLEQLVLQSMKLADDAN